MIGLRISTNSKRVLKDLHKIRGNVIPAAAAAAFTRAGETVVSKTATEIARKAKVPKWMVLGQGGAKKSRGGRLGKRMVRDPKKKHSSRKGLSGGKPIGMTIFLRSGHINPAGTAKKQAAIQFMEKGRNKGKIKVGGGKTAHYYSGAFIKHGRWPSPVILIRKGPNHLEPARIELGSWAEQILKKITITRGVRKFERRMDYEMKRRLKRYGTR